MVLSCSYIFSVVRLVGGSGLQEGLVEVFYLGTWGTVCDDGWDIREATVVCRQLGFTRATSVQHTGFSGGSEDIVLSDVRCTGSEARLVECPLLTWLPKSCSRRDSVGVQCYNQAGNHYGCMRVIWDLFDGPIKVVTRCMAVFEAH